MKLQIIFITFSILINYRLINHLNAQQEDISIEEQSLISPEESQQKEEQSTINSIENALESSVSEEEEEEEITELDKEEQEAQELIDRFPFMVSLRNYENNHYCSGVLVSDYSVLTAAQCVDDKTLNGISRPTVWLNTYDNRIEASASATIRETKAISFHPEYNGSPIDGNGLALITLNETAGHLQSAKMSFVNAYYSGKPQVFLSYGRNTKTSSFGNVLTESDIVMEDNSVCESEIDYFNSTTMFCSSNANPCVGDEGGPVMYVPYNDPKTDIFDGLIFDSDCEDDDIAPYLSITYYWPWIYETSMNIDMAESGEPIELVHLVAYYQYIELFNSGAYDNIGTDTSNGLVEGSISSLEYDDYDFDNDTLINDYKDIEDYLNDYEYHPFANLTELSISIPSFNVFYNRYCLITFCVIEILLILCLG